MNKNQLSNKLNRIIESTIKFIEYLRDGDGIKNNILDKFLIIFDTYSTIKDVEGLYMNLKQVEIWAGGESGLEADFTLSTPINYFGQIKRLQDYLDEIHELIDQIRKN